MRYYHGINQLESIIVSGVPYLLDWRKYVYQKWHLEVAQHAPLERENPHVWRESAHQYRFSVNVWAGIHGNDIIGPVFINGTLNGERFVNLLDDTLTEYTENLTVHRYQRMWYQ